MHVCTYVVLSLSRTHKHTYCNSSSNSSALLYSAFSNTTSSVLMANGTEDMFYFVCLLLLFLLLLYSRCAHSLTVIVCEQPLKQDTCFTCTHSLYLFFILSFSIFAVQFLFILACLLLFCCFFFSLLFTWSHIHTYTRNRSLTLHTVCVFVCVCRRCRRRCQLVFCLLLLLPSAAFVFSGKLLGRHTHSLTHLHTHT